MPNREPRHHDVTEHSISEQTNNDRLGRGLDALLASIPTDRSPAELARARAVAALEAAGTPAARTLLAEWAAGPPGARLTVDAKAALGRRERR